MVKVLPRRMMRILLPAGIGPFLAGKLPEMAMYSRWAHGQTPAGGWWVNLNLNQGWHCDSSKARNVIWDLSKPAAT